MGQLAKKTQSNGPAPGLRQLRAAGVAGVALVLLATGSAQAQVVAVPNTFSPGTPASSAQVNANFAALAAPMNSGAFILNQGATAQDGGFYLSGGSSVIGQYEVCDPSFLPSCAPGAAVSTMQIGQSLAVMGPTLTLMNTITAGGAGSTYGPTLDFDTYNVNQHAAPPSGSNPPSARIAAFDDGDFSGHLIFFTKTPGAGGWTNPLVERLRITDVGDVGIGTSTPTATLDVNGTAAVSGNASVGGAATITGNATVGGTATVTGNTTIGGNATVTGTTSVGLNWIQCPAPTATTSDCACPAGETVVSGGGWSNTATNVFLRESRPISTTSWRITCASAAADQVCSGQSIICSRLAP